ncbi:50S ribosomal protein L5 [Striga asiatica]|uniref:50S ribosomal protein L5 n=1 Tax=Striga asiatica TaxID=4170 RepID=A0A5A7QAI8_STRAF|nr:50S ribosomal protein L5 [Striga asiatica]
MDSTTSVGRGPNVNNQRQIWTFEEERALIQGLKKLIAREMKAGNGFRSGMEKNYVLLAPLLQNTSGVGWSESGHILEVEEPVWNGFVKGVESSAFEKGKRVGKRKRVKDAEVEVVGLLSTLCKKADQRWGQMVEHIGVQHEAKEQRKHLFLHRKINPMDRHESMPRIVERYCRPSWSPNEERECYRLFFNICCETPDVNVPAVFNSIWPHLLIQLTEEMLTYFSMLKFLTFLGTPAVEVHAESGLVTVTPTYWAYVGREMNLEYFFRHVGFPWYKECVELWDLRDAASVHMELGERVHEPIMFDDTDEEIVAADDPNGANGADLDFRNDEGVGAAGLEYMNNGANNVHELDDDVEVEEHYRSRHRRRLLR